MSKYAKKLGLIFFSTPFDLESAIFLNKLQNIFKISSGDNDFYNLIEKVLSFNKPIIISTGMLNYKEIKNYITLLIIINSKIKFVFYTVFQVILHQLRS